MDFWGGDSGIRNPGQNFVTLAGYASYSNLQFSSPQRTKLSGGQTVVTQKYGIVTRRLGEVQLLLFAYTNTIIPIDSLDISGLLFVDTSNGSGLSGKVICYISTYVYKLLV